MKSKWARVILAVVGTLVLAIAVPSLLSSQRGPRATPTVAAPTPTPPRPALVVEVESCKWDAGYSIAEGVVRNTGAATARTVFLRLTVTDAAGATVNTFAGVPDSDQIAAGASATFRLLVPDDKRVGARCEVEVDSYR